MKLRAGSKWLISMGILVVIAIGFSFLYYYPEESNEEIKVIMDSSYFSSFKVVDDTVQMSCVVAIENLTGESKVVEIYAIDYDDVEMGLLGKPILVGYDDKLMSTEFLLDESYQVFEVIFVGEFGGAERKANRLLPIINIEVIR